MSRKRRINIHIDIKRYLPLMIVVAILIAVGVLVTVKACNKDHVEPPRVAVKYDGQELKQDQAIGKMKSGAVFTVSGEEDYTVKITAAKQKGDFSFFLWEEVVPYSDVAGKDVTNGFTVTKKADTFTLSYVSLADVLKRSYNLPVTFYSEASADFILTVSSGEKTLNVTFTLEQKEYTPITSEWVQLDKSEIVF